MHPAMTGPAGDPRSAILAQLLHPGGGPAGPAPPPDQPDAADKANISPLHAVQSVIEDMHDLMRLLPDPGAVNVVATCLKAMTGLQATMMKPGGGGGS
jgi:hypothetical protein